MKRAFQRFYIGTFDDLRRLPRNFKAVVLLSTQDTADIDIRAEGFRRLPTLWHYRIDKNQPWDTDQTHRMALFLVAKAQIGDVLIASDDGLSRAPYLLVRMLQVMGFRKRDALNMLHVELPNSNIRGALLAAAPERETESLSTQPPGRRNRMPFERWSSRIGTKAMGIPEDLARAMYSERGRS